MANFLEKLKKSKGIVIEIESTKTLLVLYPSLRSGSGKSGKVSIVSEQRSVINLNVSSK